MRMGRAMMILFPEPFMIIRDAHSATPCIVVSIGSRRSRIYLYVEESESKILYPVYPYVKEPLSW